MHSTHFIYGYMASDIWLRTILIVRKETRCCHIGYSFRLTARVLLYAPSHRQDITYHGLWYTSRGALARTKNSSMGSPHEGSIRRPIAPWANALTTELHLAPFERGLWGHFIARHQFSNHKHCCSVCSHVRAFKRSLAANGKSRPCSGGCRFPRSLSGPLPYVRCHITVSSMCWVHH